MRDGAAVAEVEQRAVVEPQHAVVANRHCATREAGNCADPRCGIGVDEIQVGLRITHPCRLGVGEDDMATVGAERQRAYRLGIGEFCGAVEWIDDLEQCARCGPAAIGEIQQPQPQDLLGIRRVGAIPCTGGDRQLVMVGRCFDSGDHLVGQRVLHHRLPTTYTGRMKSEACRGGIVGFIAIVGAPIVAHANDAAKAGLEAGVGKRSQRDQSTVACRLHLPAAFDRVAVGARGAGGVDQQRRRESRHRILGVIGGVVAIAGQQVLRCVEPTHMVVGTLRREPGLAIAAGQIECFDVRALRVEGVHDAQQVQSIGRDVGVQEVPARINGQGARCGAIVAGDQADAVATALHGCAGGIDRAEVFV